ncbi:3-hydroxybutyrate dehydrogenase [Flexibacter flexilis DSM 6793]|uniref:3-hydroxybutyrate dehydrogenase n=1 Tax=Flexibacter flexilis DSM 6793 TaxID=927664 RepID=A0A1I1N8E3_9BACT|nr:3-hydroxybutyrate dehydrogenase [Flexibacter flexilis]SFC91738.1 3-hydroxybutyrate dehydrogenase [Flexibacter flexilis DSM 6793]
MAKTVLITGSTSGIGLGIAKEFAKAGYNVAFNGLEANGAEIAAAIGQEFGVKTTFSAANMLNPDQIAQMIADAEAAFGGVDVLVNNAGIQFVSPIEDFPTAKWDAIIGINLSSAFHTSKAVWKGMKERKFGRIINITSAHGLRASEFKSAYVAAKHGVTGLTKVLGLEGAPYNITCNAICPGYVRTPLVEGQIKDQATAHGMSEADVVAKVMLKKQAIKDFVTVESLGALAVFLASDAASMMTGASLPVDGGWTAQ